VSVGLGPVECLNLGFLVHAQYQRLLGRIQIEFHNIFQLLDKSLVPAKLERLDEMRLKVVLFPDSTNAGLRQPLCLRHAARAPVRRVRRSCVQSRLDNRFDFPSRDPRFPARAGRVLFESRHPQGQEPLPSKLNGWPGQPQFRRDILIGYAGSRHQDDMSSYHKPKGHRTTARVSVQRSLLGLDENDRRCFSAHDAA